MAKEKAHIDCTGLLDSSNVKTSKNTESSIIITQINGIALEGMFKEYSKVLEDMVFKSGIWRSIKTGRQAKYWSLKLLVASGEELCQINGCVIEDIAIKRGKENVIVFNLKIKHHITVNQGDVSAAVSTNVRFQLIPDDTYVETPKEDETGTEGAHD